MEGNQRTMIGTEDKDLLDFLERENALYDYLYYRLEDVVKMPDNIIVNIDIAFTWKLTNKPNYWMHLNNKYDKWRAINY